MPYIVGKILARDITLHETSFQSEVCKRSYGLQSNGNPNFEFGTLDLGVPGKMRFGSAFMARHIKYYKGDGGGFP
jgi:hypothetical protein